MTVTALAKRAGLCADSPEPGPEPLRPAVSAEPSGLVPSAAPGGTPGAAPGGSAASWRDLPAAQQPDWPEPAALRAAVAELAAYPPLVRADECDRLRTGLAAVARGEAFLLQGGDCAESFDAVSAGQIRAKVRTLRQMADVLAFAAAVPVVTVGRIAGQYSKPRSRPTETRDGVTLPSYRGDSVNGGAFTVQDRTPDPERLKRMYHASAATLDLLRALAARGYAGQRQVREWNKKFVRSAASLRRFEALARDVGEAPESVGESGAQWAELFASHEALVLDYEGALTRGESGGNAGEGLYGLSGHMVWIGERTRQLDGAHVEFASRIRNPVGVKLGPTTTTDEALALVDRLDPEREPGRLTFITRMGADRIRDVLPALVEKTAAEGACPVWVCDPMHGNTFEAPSGHKTRRLDTVLEEITGFFEVHRGLGTHPGGVHLELTGERVTECVGGGVTAGDLHRRYETACDPRLNDTQALELAFLVGELMRAG
ncbi:class II 3-deoxy-7-phosphoheptulonate synthase [Streptomyces sp. NBC_00388]|uniref:class II 3-deoxy-7-phosphoheptulonate synthase n=1 Tax=Streptomyces sp. NBC_00388 TaxID=2975735 RepID=UPI002E24D19C